MTRSHTTRRSPAVFCSILLLFFAASSDAAELTVTLDGGAVAVRGVAAGREVILFGIGIGTHGRAVLLTRDLAPLRDDDGDGEIRYVPRLRSFRSVWIAVDAATGQYAMATHDGAPAPALHVARVTAGAAEMDVRGAYLEALLVRPGAGAWSLRLADGGAHDADGASNRTMRLRADRMRTLGADAPPDSLAAGDLVVLVDPESLGLHVSEVQ